MSDTPTTSAQEIASENPKEKFLQALAAVQANAALSEGFYGTPYKKNAEPLKDSTIVFLNEADLDLAEEFKLITVLIRKIFEFTKTGLDQDDQRWHLETVQKYLNFIQLARSRYAEIASDTFWHPFLQLVAAEAAKRFYPLKVKGRTCANYVKEQEEAKTIIEEINGILPLPQIEAHRAAFAEKIKETIEYEAALVYETIPGNTPSRSLDEVMANAQKYGVNVPTKSEFWERAIARFTELFDECEHLTVLVETKNFSEKYHALLKNIESSVRDFDSKKTSVQEVEFKGQKVSVDAFLTEMKEKVDQLGLANKTFEVNQELESVFEKLNAAVQSLTVATFSTEYLESLIEKMKNMAGSDSGRFAQKKATLLGKIDPYLNTLLNLIQADNSRAAEIAPHIGKIGDLRNRIGKK